MPTASAAPSALLRRGRYREAATAYTEQLQHAKDPDAYVGLGRSLVELGQFVQAEEAFRKAIALAPEDLEAHTGLAFLLYNTGRSGEACEELVRVVDLCQRFPAPQPNGFERYDALGRALQALDRHDEAQSAFRRARPLLQDAIARDPGNPDAWSSLAYIADELGDAEGSLKAYDTVLSLRDTDSAARFNRGIVLDELGRYEDAAQAFREYIERMPSDPDGHATLGLVLGKLGRYIEAEMACQKALDIRPTDSTANAAFGFALEGLHQQGEAEMRYRAALGQEPNDAETLNNLARLLNDMDRPDEAEGFATEAVRQKESWQALGTLAAIDIKLAVKYHDINAYQDAITAVRKAAARVPSRLSDRETDNVAMLDFLLGTAQVSVGQLMEARSAFKKCLRQASATSDVRRMATRQLRITNRRLWVGNPVPVWLAPAVAALALVGIAYAISLMERAKLDGVAFAGLLFGLAFVIFASFSLPSITTLKIGPAELQKTAGIQSDMTAEKS